MSHDPVKDLADHLDSNTTQLTIDSNLFYGPVRPFSTANPGMPATAVFVLGTGGPPPQRIMGTTAQEVRDAAVQVRVRSTSYQNALALSRTVNGVLQSASPSSYLDVQARQSEPVYLEADERLHYHFSINYLVVYTSTGA